LACRAVSRYTPSLFDRLLDDDPQVESEPTLVRLSLEQLKDSVARDLEALLNTRCGLAADVLQPWRHCRTSILSFGMIDFADLTLASPRDRDLICQSIEAAIRAHEPRLRVPRVSLAGPDGRGESRLRFSIHALLRVGQASEPVNFDASLQTTTQQYAVRRAGGEPVAG